MATNITLDGSNIDLNWATEETQRLILQAVSVNKVINQQSKKAENAAARESASSLNKFSAATKAATSRVASRLGNFANNFDSNTSTLPKFSKSIFGLIGKASGLGAMFGFGATMLENFMTAQTDAIQSGFEFSNQLISTRSSLAAIGLNFNDFTNIIAENGNAIKGLGNNGTKAASEFSNLVKSARAGTKSMGYFGLTSSDIANELADIVGTLQKSGLSGNALRLESAKSFVILNREVLGYAKLTGRNRRNIMRNDSLVSDDNMFLSTLSTLGKDASATMTDTVRSVTSMFGGDGGAFVSGIVKQLIESKVSGFNRMTNEETAVFQNMPGFEKILIKLRDNVLNSKTTGLDSATKSNRGIVKELANYVSNMEGKARNNAFMYAKTAGGQSFADQFRQIVGMAVNSRQSKAAINKKGGTTTEFSKGLSDSTLQLIKFKTEMQTAVEQFKGMLTSVLGFESVASLKAFNFNKLGDQFQTFGDKYKGAIGNPLSSAMDTLFNGKLDAMTAAILLGTGVAIFPKLTKAIVLGAATMFGAKKAGSITWAFVKGINKLFNLAPNATKAAKTAAETAKVTAKTATDAANAAAKAAYIAKTPTSNAGQAYNASRIAKAAKVEANTAELTAKAAKVAANTAKLAANAAKAAELAKITRSAIKALKFIAPGAKFLGPVATAGSIAYDGVAGVTNPKFKKAGIDATGRTMLGITGGVMDAVSTLNHYLNPFEILSNKMGWTNPLDLRAKSGMDTAAIGNGWFGKTMQYKPFASTNNSSDGLTPPNRTLQFPAVNNTDLNSYLSESKETNRLLRKLNDTIENQ